MKRVKEIEKQGEERFSENFMEKVEEEKIEKPATAYNRDVLSN